MSSGPSVSLGNSPASAGLGSSLAEKIFNDPDSWHNSNDTSTDDDDGNVTTWLLQQPENYSDQLGGEAELPPVEPSVKHKHISGRFKRSHVQWEGVSQEDNPLFLPIFQPTGLDLSIDLNNQLSTIWDHGSTFSPQSDPSPILFSPPSSPSTGQSVTSPDMGRTSAPSLKMAAEIVNPPNSPTSPVAVLSASTTWSILELYGVPPDTPVSGRPIIAPHRPSSLLPVSSVAPLPASCEMTPPPTLSLTTNVAGEITNDPTLVRPLPLIPDSVRDSPAPSRVNTPVPLSRRPSNLPSLPSQLSNSSLPPPIPKTPQSQPRRLSKAQPIETGDTSLMKPPRKSYLPIGTQILSNQRPSPTPRMKTAELTRFASLPLSSSRISASDPSSPSATPSPHRSRPPSATRSPPLGPRSRSLTLSSQPQ